MTAAGDVVARVLEAFSAVERAARPEVWITLRDPADVLSDATAVEERLAGGETPPLAGTVFAVKDNIDVAGLKTTAAHPAFGYTPERSATAVLRLEQAGAVLLGKTNLDQFATGLTGTRSPYGAVRGAVFPDRISGGSSSGSAVAVALGIVDFALGTDTAGSGRVPAALNEIVGLKPTPGLVPSDGVVPACASFDCVSVLAAGLDLAREVMALLCGPSPLDPCSRPWPSDVVLAAPDRPRVAVPRPADLTLLSHDARKSFEHSRALLEERGARTGEIGLAPFREAAALLYEGGLVAERHFAFGTFLADHPEGADPCVARIAADAGRISASAYLEARRRLGELRVQAMETLGGFDALLLPTATRHPTLAEVEADPFGVNSELGAYTNFVNLFGMAAVAMPAERADGGCFGVSVLARPFADQVAIDIAALLSGERPPAGTVTSGTPLVVFGAHLRGQPFNHQLQDLGARFVRDVRTTPDYRMYLLPGSPARPAVVPVSAGTGTAVAGEEWLLSPAALGRFLAGLPRPMTLGATTLADGRTVPAFGAALDGTATDISRSGGWRAHLESLDT